MNPSFQRAREMLARRPDHISDVVDLLYAARLATDEALRRAEYALEAKERELEQLRREMVESDVRWYSEPELAARIGIGEDTLARLRRQKKIPCSKFGRLVRYSSLDELEIAKRCQVKAKFVMEIAA